MTNFRNWIASIHDPVIDRERALEIARAECERRDLAWQEPVRVMWEFGSWAVWTNDGHRGGNVRIVVDKTTGEVRSVSGPIAR